MSSNEKRLNKFISDSGYCSRREADKLIEKHRVTINGKVPELGTKVQPGDEVLVDGRPIKAIAKNKSDRIYIAYNKPIGIICTTERHIRGNITDAIGHTKRIFPIGRLDKPSEGLIFLTSDGDIVNKILRAENAHDKEYIVTVNTPISERFIERMSKGVPILGTITKPCIVTVQSKFVFRIVLTQGLNRQIRRMCEYLDYEVTKLKRSRIMSVELGSLQPGQWRNLTTDEMNEINAAVAHSSKTAPGDDHQELPYVDETPDGALDEAQAIIQPVDTSKLDFNRGKKSIPKTTRSKNTSSDTGKKKPTLSIKRKS